MAQDILGKEHFQQAYAGMAPWDIGRPQPAFVEAADQITGSVLDVGCGTGENAMFFARRGHQATGIDFLEHPIAEATRKTQDRNLPATFRVMDALRLEELADRFDSVIDCGLFHVFSDQDRPRYVEGLASVVRPGGKIFMMCFSDREPPGEGPRRVSQDEIHEVFDSGWNIESIQQVRFEIRPDLQGNHFSEGGPFAWFCVIRKSELPTDQGFEDSNEK